MVDAVYCISLQEDSHRYEQSRKILKQVGLLDMTQYYRPVRDPQGGQRGCYESHRTVITLAKKHLHLKYILILEDDVVFNKFFSQQRLAENIDTFQHKFPEADIFFLGHMPALMWPTLNTKLFFCKSGQAHAYILNLNGPMAHYVINHSFEQQLRLPIDILYLTKAYSLASFPMMAYQRHVSVSETNSRTSVLEKFLYYLFFARPDISARVVEILVTFLLLIVVFLIAQYKYK